MNPKTGMLLFGLSLLWALTSWLSGYIFPQAEWPATLLPLGLQAMYVFALLLIFQFSSLGTGPHWKWLLAGCIIVLVGSSFRIMHWPGSFALNFAGLSLLLLTYLHRFLKKAEKNGIDFLKVLWFSGMIIAFLMILTRTGTDLPVLVILQFLFWLMFVWFLITQFAPYYKNIAK